MKFEETKEEWRPIEGYEGIYEVSNKGRVKSLERIVPHLNSYQKIKSRIKKSATNKHGYVNIPLSKGGVCKTYILSRLVAKAFIPNPENKEQVNHISGDKQDNSVANLEWCTQSENQLHKYSHLGHPPPTLGKKILSTRVAIIQYTYNWEFIREWDSMKEAAKVLGVCRNNISFACRNNNRSVKSFRFKYKKDVII